LKFAILVYQQLKAFFSPHFSKSQFQSYFVGTARLDGKKVTIKEHHIVHYPEIEVAEEIRLLAKLSHDSVPKMSEIFITNISVFVVTNFIDSMRLKHFIDFKDKTTKLSAQDSRKIIKSLISATNYCHTNGVIVRNLTADSIMVKSVGTDSFDVMITDFSLAVPDDSLKVLCDHTLFEWDAVPYMAPEALLGHPYTNKMDIWSIGVLLYLMVSGELPFVNTDDKELINSIKFASFVFREENPVWESVSPKVKHLIGQLLVADPAERLTGKDLLKDEWIVVG
jgi:serine/threonine kinase 33